MASQSTAPNRASPPSEEQATATAPATASAIAPLTARATATAAGNPMAFTPVNRPSTPPSQIRPSNPPTPAAPARPRYRLPRTLPGQPYPAPLTLTQMLPPALTQTLSHPVSPQAPGTPATPETPSSSSPPTRRARRHRPPLPSASPAPTPPSRPPRTPQTPRTPKKQPPASAPEILTLSREIHTLPAKCPSGKGYDAGSPIRCVHKEPGRYVCMSPLGWARPHCQRVFPSLCHLRRHHRVIHGPKTQTCGRCGRHFYGKLSWDLHLFRVHGLPLGGPGIEDLEEGGKGVKVEVEEPVIKVEDVEEEGMGVRMVVEEPELEVKVEVVEEKEEIGLEGVQKEEEGVDTHGVQQVQMEEDVGMEDEEMELEEGEILEDELEEGEIREEVDLEEDGAVFEAEHDAVPTPRSYHPIYGFYRPTFSEETLDKAEGKEIQPVWP
ncbi:uncharacterized protein BO72DRAFT_483154 [Aspergillus fijiensis CBS 313.89]|uniref:C2H2-type domain-containing protein n=1 Tax=Aspergillus fijiensis CBS 313.89 TaxID=1448319 RepID=A0A8G1RWU2_9EURO|nr:uncharacterized protein BO72DRAFT_483154 [Aspergillus fijiensis CBS 313.89]RAK81502.1 hypothetical protein BO72DRAFT_483154 [Aspergillus fijiensis CBS 313.89]